MRTKKTLIVLILFSLLILSSPAYASRVSMTSKSYSDAGIKNYKDGHLAAAIDDFSKAILSDPSNMTAKSYLHKMGVEREIFGYHVQPATEVAKLAQELNIERIKRGELSDEHTALVEHCSGVEAQNNLLCRQVESQQAQLSKAQIALDIVKKNFSQRLEGASKDAQHYQGIASEAVDKNETFERVTAKQNDVISGQNIELGYKDEAIDTLKKRVKLVRRASLDEVYGYEDRRIEMEKSYHETIGNLQAEVTGLEASRHLLREKSIATINALKEELERKERELEDLTGGLSPDSVIQLEIDDKIALIKQKDDDIAKLKERMAGMSHQIREMRISGAPGSDEKVQELRAQLRDAQVSLQDQTMNLTSKESDLRILQQRLADAKERLELVSEIVNEKDDMIRMLEDELDNIQSQCQIAP